MEANRRKLHSVFVGNLARDVKKVRREGPVRCCVGEASENFMKATVRTPLVLGRQ